MAEDSEIAAMIGRVVTSFWKSQKQPLYLTGLSPLLSQQEGFDFKEHLQGRKMLGYVQKLEASEFVIESLPGQELNWVLFPPDVTLDEAAEAAAGAKQRAATAMNTGNGARYVRPFWAAFVKLLEDGKDRFINLDVYPMLFRDIEQGETLPAPWRLIPRERINTNLDYADPEVVSRHVEAWIADNGIDRTRLLDKGAVDKPAATRSFDPASVPDLMAFLQSLASLPRSELARISIPLDIIVSTFEKR